MIQYPTLSIAGFDPSGGAGLQADLKTFSAFGNYGMTVLTALAVQNTTGVKSYYAIPLQAISEQLDAVLDDIPPSAIKLGMLFNSDIISLIAQSLKKKAAQTPMVLDPVMRAKSGDALLLPEAEDSLKKLLLPLASIVTPNLPEAWTLIGVSYGSTLSFEHIAEKILNLGAKAVLVKGGHADGSESSDLLAAHDGTMHWLHSPRISTKNSHGTGCTLSAAIAACLARGMELKEAVITAKYFLTQALKSAAVKNVGYGVGPTDHNWQFSEDRLFQMKDQ